MKPVMKVKKLMRYNLMVALMIFGSLAMAQEDRKDVNKTYKVESDTELEIKNSFGKIHIENWDKQEFEINVEIIARGSNADRARRNLDNIDIQISENSDSYQFETKIGNTKNNGKDGSGIEINYSVRMPAVNPVRINNSFGDVYLDDRAGDADVKVSYGELQAGNFTGDLNLRISFGSGSLENINLIESVIKYSKVEFDEIKSMDLAQSFSDIEIENIDKLDLEAKYGSVEIDEAGEIDADVEFSGFSIERLNGSIDLESNYVSGFKIGQLATDFDFVYITGKFGSYEIGIMPGTNANIEGKFSFSDLKVFGPEVDFNYRVKENNKAEYRGKIGTGDAQRKIIVSSSYGNLRLKQ